MIFYSEYRQLKVHSIRKLIGKFSMHLGLRFPYSAIWISGSAIYSINDTRSLVLSGEKIVIKIDQKDTNRNTKLSRRINQNVNNTIIKRLT